MVEFGLSKRWLFVFWITLLILFSISPSPIAAQGGITLQVEPFFNGHYKYGEWLPLRVTVTNAGAPVSAQVRVEMTQTGGESAWLVPVELPTGAQKQFTLYVLPTSFAQLARARLLSGAQELAKQNATLTLHPNTDYLVGVVAPRSEPFNAFNSASLGGGPPRTVRALPLALKDIPERAEGLRLLDALVLTDVDTSALSPAQTRALTAWVQQGGRLIVGGGASAARTLAGLPDALVAEFRAQNTVAELNALDALGEFGESPVRVPGPFVAAFTWSGDVLLDENGDTLLAETRVGDGYVTYSALDLAASPFDAWAGAARFWTKIFAPGSAYPQNTPPDVSPHLIHLRFLATTLQNLPALALPSINVLAILLSAYILLVGPLNYLALRRLKKLDWGWVTIPALTLLFALGAFGVSNQLRGSDVILNQISVVDFAADGAPRQVETVVGLFSPTRSSFNLEMAQDSFVIPVSNQYDPFARGQEAQGMKLEIVQSDPLVVRGIELNQGALQGFAIASPAPTDWRIEAALNVQGERVHGTLKHGLSETLKDVVLVDGGRYLRLGDLPPNQSHAVDQNWQAHNGNYTVWVSDSSPRGEARRQILSARFDFWQKGGRANAPPTLIGWLDASPLDVRVQNVAAARQTQTLVTLPLTFTFEKGARRLGQDDWRIEQVSAVGEQSNCGTINYVGIGNGELVLDFVPSSALNYTRIKSLNVLVKDGPPQTIALQDTANEWVTVSLTQPGTFPVEQPERFVKSNGGVRLRISSKSSLNSCALYAVEMEAEVE